MRFLKLLAADDEGLRTAPARSAQTEFASAFDFVTSKG